MNLNEFETNLPQRNSYLIIRKDVFDKIEIYFESNDFLALSSIGGSGKTSTAFEYAYQLKDKFECLII